jgi:hypothetical protein
MQGPENRNDKKVEDQNPNKEGPTDPDMLLRLCGREQRHEDQ